MAVILLLEEVRSLSLTMRSCELSSLISSVLHIDSDFVTVAGDRRTTVTFGCINCVCTVYVYVYTMCVYVLKGHLCYKCI